MVLTANQLIHFFEDEDQMGIPRPTRLQIREEGIRTVEDLEDFDDNFLKQLATNLKKPGGRIADPANPGQTIPAEAFSYPTKLQKRMAVACKLVKYYRMVGRPTSAANMQ